MRSFHQESRKFILYLMDDLSVNTRMLVIVRICLSKIIRTSSSKLPEHKLQCQLFSYISATWQLTSFNIT